MKEKWKWINKYRGYYKVSNFGRIKSVERTITTKTKGYFCFRWGKKVWIPPFEKIIKYKERIIRCERKDGRAYVSLCKKGKIRKYYIARLVLESFVGPCPEGMISCHFPDPNPSNCYLKNLRWDSYIGNKKDQYVHEKEKQKRYVKLTERKVQKIKILFNSGNWTLNELACKFHVSPSHICKILKGKRWHRQN